MIRYRPMTRTAILPSFAILLALAACGGREETPAPEAAPQAQAPAADSGAGSPIGPISSREGSAPSAPMGGGAPADAQPGTINFELPSGWVSQPPSSNMRIAQAEIPGSAGAGQLVVFYFGPGGGGTVEANIERWIGQMETPPGANPQPQTFETGTGYKVTWIDVPGTLKPSTMGMGPETEQPNSRLLGGIVEGPGGPWFFKATGPDATITAGRDAFINMLKSVRARLA